MTVAAESRYGNVTGVSSATVYVIQVGYLTTGYWSELSDPLVVNTSEGEKWRKEKIGGRVRENE